MILKNQILRAVTTPQTIHYIIDMVIVRLKTERDKKVQKLLNMFKLPSVNNLQGYQTKPNPALTGGSATMATVMDLKLKAVNELLKWIRLG
jgi:hypothetical protein